MMFMKFSQSSYRAFGMMLCLMLLFLGYASIASLRISLLENAIRNIYDSKYVSHITQFGYGVIRSERQPFEYRLYNVITRDMLNLPIIGLYSVFYCSNSNYIVCREENSGSSYRIVVISVPECKAVIDVRISQEYNETIYSAEVHNDAVYLFFKGYVIKVNERALTKYASATATKSEYVQRTCMNSSKGVYCVGINPDEDMCTLYYYSFDTHETKTVSVYGQPNTVAGSIHFIRSVFTGDLAIVIGSNVAVDHACITITNDGIISKLHVINSRFAEMTYYGLSHDSKIYIGMVGKRLLSDTRPHQASCIMLSDDTMRTLPLPSIGPGHASSLVMGRWLVVNSNGKNTVIWDLISLLDSIDNDQLLQKTQYIMIAAVTLLIIVILSCIIPLRMKVRPPITK